MAQAVSASGVDFLAPTRKIQKQSVHCVTFIVDLKILVKRPSVIL